MQLGEALRSYYQEELTTVNGHAETTIKGIKDPDQRNYFVSNDKLKKKGFKAKRGLNEGIKELIKGFDVEGLKIKNNY